MPERLTYFIDWFPQKPVVLIPGRRYRIGRGADNEFYIPDVHASREHAEITWDRDAQSLLTSGRPGNGAFVLTDFGSSNGTFLNGQPVTDPVILEEADEIRIGTTVLRLRVEEAKKAAEDYEKTKKQVQEWQTVVGLNVDMVEGRQPIDHGGLSGVIEDVSLPQVIQMLEAGSSTGRLLVTSTGASGAVEPSPGGPEDVVGSVYFKNGQVIAAGYVAGESAEDVFEGVEAVYALLALRVGTFEFLAEDVSHIEPTIQESTQALLMEGMKRLDEQGRGAQGAEPTREL